MSKYRLYIDGCSYTMGHEPGIISWTSKIINGARDTTLDRSFTAKSNEHMVLDFFNNAPMLSKDAKVIIFWSHCERYVPYYNRNALYPCKMVDIKNLSGKEVTIPYNLLTGQQMPPNFPYMLYDMHLIKTMFYMYQVQEYCKLNSINHYFITTDPYYKFKSIMTEQDIVNWASKLDSRRIFNWPCYEYTPLNVENKYEYGYFVLEWAVHGLVTSWCRAFGENTGSILLDKDKKHMNQTGLNLFGEQILNWINDLDKNLLYLIDNELSYDAGRHFKETQYAINNFQKTSHWVERTAYDYIAEAKLMADFVYEKDK